MAALLPLLREVWTSTDLLFQTKLNWLLVLGPVALIGDATGLLGEPICFICSGLALIPCAERLSFVTEQVAAHTNGTIGALLNATFGNAPELLISTAAMRSGFYRVVQLAMLGSMLTNLLFVFGVSCLVGGLRWQVQELRITSGNVSVLMLLVATAGSLLPAALNMSGQMKHDSSQEQTIATTAATTMLSSRIPSDDELTFSRINAFVMIIMYICYLLFQLGTHKEEFDEEENIVETPDHLLLMSPHFTSRHGRKKRAERNRFCLQWFGRGAEQTAAQAHAHQGYSTVELMERGSGKSRNSDNELEGESERAAAAVDDLSESDDSYENGDGLFRTTKSSSSRASRSLPSLGRRRRRASSGLHTSFDNKEEIMVKDVVVPPSTTTESTAESSGAAAAAAPNHHHHDAVLINGGGGDMNRASVYTDASEEDEQHAEPLMSFAVGIVWLFIITLCISAMSDILVDTIDGFAYRCHLSQVFTSMVIVPFFSNIAEQVSAILFAYRNEMDLCVGVTVGSAIQIATFVLPGCVLIGMFVDRSMTLFFHGYETACLVFGVICVAAVLQGGTTNWLVGMSLIAIYTMLAAGFWFHEIEDLSIDAELFFQNQTRSLF
eukprot:CAMPEP_0119010040 /NCGR_PEP_ID=MMETSP1176-20130426/4752_1 /TAXON_ID=265551 /ORGANISM="Synedropsis recta cf, Strain CCMP1620" /LENGTH=607 /DNA_ID=CAMNT_0006962635 /DNA_START=300 /DNA_END=2123 /DNA_ORIENTATION=-